MIKKFLPILLLLICTTVHASPSMLMMAGGSSSGPTCSNNISTDYVGDKTTRTGNTTNANNYLWCQRFQASASCATGTLEKGHFKHYGTGTGNVKICVYNSTDTTPVTASTADSLIGCSSSVAVDADQAYATADIGGTITDGNYYWVCGIQDATVYFYRDISSGAGVYTASSSFSSPPASFSGLTFNFTDSRKYELWVAIE